MSREDPLRSMVDSAPRFSYLTKREEIVRAITSEKSVFDVVIVGGGIHGASLAWTAALNGLRTVLLERDDFASGTSSRSSKMVHGGLRYLELFDFVQVFEGIRARESLFESASHLARPYRFLIPIKKGEQFLKWKMSIGLSLYDLLIKNPERKHRWVPESEMTTEVFGSKRKDLLGCFEYCDGIMSDTRIVIESLTAARQEGALALNYAEVLSFSHRKSGTVEVGWRDTVSGEQYTTTCGVVFNCAGPWVGRVGRLSAGTLQQKIRYSQGSHLVFSKTWNEPPLFLPLPGKARYYWIWPHPGGTLVGTTEREVETPERDPVPFSDEIEEILERVKRDLPDAGLTKENLSYAFAGTRTLALRKPAQKGRGVPLLSRRHLWEYDNGVLSLVGGKYTTAQLTAYEGLKKAFALAGNKLPLVSVEKRSFPGHPLNLTEREDFLSKGRLVGVPEDVLARACARWGRRITAIETHDNGFNVLGKVVLEGEVREAIEAEQVETLEDLIRRRLELEYLPSHGLSALSGIVKILESYYPGSNFQKEAEAYQLRFLAQC